jgi:hypothetical protein
MARKPPAVDGNMLSSDYREALKEELKETGMPDGYAPSDQFGGIFTTHNRAGNDHGGRPFNAGMDLRGVAEVLASEGLDPTLELAKLIKGFPDPEEPSRTVYLIEHKVRAHMLNELLKYVHPQKKAVEVDQRVTLKGRELDARLQQLMQQFSAKILGQLPDEVIEEAIIARELPTDPWDMV